MICKRKEGKMGISELRASRHVPLATSVVVGKLWRLTICTPLASCVAVNELHTVGKLCGSG
jgi:hypothetical protein